MLSNHQVLNEIHMYPCHCSQTSALIQSKTKIQSKTPLATVLSTHPVQIQMHIHHDTSAILLVILCVSKTTDNDLAVCTEFSVNM